MFTVSKSLHVTRSLCFLDCRIVLHLLISPFCMGMDLIDFGGHFVMSDSKCNEDIAISSESGSNNGDQSVAAVISLPVDGAESISFCQLTYFI